MLRAWWSADDASRLRPPPRPVLPLTLTLLLSTRSSTRIWSASVVCWGVYSSGNYVVGSGVDGMLHNCDVTHMLTQSMMQVAMEKQWLQYEEEEDLISMVVADALLDDLLLDITAQLVQ
jgi:hypothetical protein